jgi:hypothetical protein
MKWSPFRKNEEKHAQRAAEMADRDASVLRTGELLAILRQRGVSVQGALEREELVALVRHSGGIPASTPVPAVPPHESDPPSSPQPLAVPPARLTIAARVRVSTVRVSTIAAGAPTRHVMENEFDRTSSTARPTPPCQLPLVRRPGT